MNVARLRPRPLHQAVFDLFTLERTPDSVGCYSLTNASGDILYIGQAVSVRRRLIQHFDGDKRAASTRYGRVSLAYWIDVEAIALSAVERGWIDSVRLFDGELPPLNRIGGPT
jgi:predicted GIY-YIG superfamily endonuclease